MEINAKEREMEMMAKERERKMDMQILNADTSTMSEKRRVLHRFRMRRHMFLRIVDALSNVYPYFQQRVDATRRRGLSPLQKCTAAIRILAYDIAVDYLRKPNPNDVRRLLQMAEDRGFPGMLVLEVVASSDLWIWHAFFGVSGSNNDINVLDRFSVFDDILNDRVLEVGHK
ncbi:uncharacterized protein [Arachis hypogaea]|uniref:uncharacterized protein n=1 Tax=Arachis hypogaea TaxID=3818 RepID=UPI000DEC6C67|nr:uncharacterized protein LOC112723231 [Arachis hypogaea]